MYRVMCAAVVVQQLVNIDQQHQQQHGDSIDIKPGRLYALPVCVNTPHTILTWQFTTQPKVRTSAHTTYTYTHRHTHTHTHSEAHTHTHTHTCTHIRSTLRFVHSLMIHHATAIHLSYCMLAVFMAFSYIID